MLAKAGCQVDVLSPVTSALFHTRYASERFEAPDNIDDFLALFARRRAERDYRWIIAVDDPLLEALCDAPAAQLRPWFPIDPDHDGFLIVRGKVGFCRAAKRWGLPIPATRIVHSLAEAHAAAHALGFPVVLKRDVSFAGMGVRAVRSPDRLTEQYEQLEDDHPCVVQEMIDGPLGNTAALFVHGRPVAWMTAYKARTWPHAFGPSCARKFVDRPEMASILTMLGARTGYHGFLALDWIEQKPVSPGCPGDLVFLELNARPVPAIQMAPTVGVDFSKAIPALFGESVAVQVPVVTAHTAEEIFPMFPQDLFRAITSGDQQQLDAWACGSGPFDDVPWDDPSLIEWHIRGRSVRRHFSRVFGTRLPLIAQGKS